MNERDAQDGPIRQDRERGLVPIEGVAALDPDERAMLSFRTCGSILRGSADELELVLHRLEDRSEPCEVRREDGFALDRRARGVRRDDPRGPRHACLANARKVDLAVEARAEEAVVVALPQ